MVYPKDKTLCEKSYEWHLYELDGAEFGRQRGFAGEFQKEIKDGAYSHDKKVGTVQIDDKKYSIDKINLKEIHGHYKINTEFYLKNSNNNVVGGYFTSLLLEKGMEIHIKGADDLAIENFMSESDYVDFVLNESSDMQLTFERVDDTDEYVGYLDNAASYISAEGTGKMLGFAGLAVDLNDGYVIQKVTGANENEELGYTYERATLYSPLDEDGQPIDDYNYLRHDLLWNYCIEGSGGENMIYTFYSVANYLQSYMQNYNYAKLRNDDKTIAGDIAEFKELCDARKDVTFVPQGSYNDYTVYFNEGNDNDSTQAIVFYVAKATADADSDTITAVNNGVGDNGFTSQPVPIGTATEESLTNKIGRAHV